MIFLGNLKANQHRDDVMIISITHEQDLDKPDDPGITFALTPPRELFWALAGGVDEKIFAKDYYSFLEKERNAKVIGYHYDGKILCTNTDVIWRTVAKWLRDRGVGVVELDGKQQELNV